MMLRAKAVVESAGYTVVLGILAPTSQDWVQWKCQQVMVEEHRMEALRIACEEACEPEPWLRSDPRGRDYGSDYKMQVRLLDWELQQQYPGIVGFRVKGADVVVRFGGFYYEAQSPTVLVCRAGSTAELLAGLEKEVGKLPASCLIVEELEGTFSSTKLREALLAEDEDSVRLMCGPRVASYLLEHRASLFQEPSESTGDPVAVSEEEAESSRTKKPRVEADVATDSKDLEDEAELPPLHAYFVRHGEALHNVDEEEGWKTVDTALTELGLQQARALQEHPLLLELPTPVTVVVSPLKRALQTALGALEGKGRFLVHRDLQESGRFACNCGRPVPELEAEFPSVDFSLLTPEVWADRRGPRDRVELPGRLQSLTRWCAGRSEEVLVLVGHGQVFRKLLGPFFENCEVLGATLDRRSLEWQPLAYYPLQSRSLRWAAEAWDPSGFDFLLRAMTAEVCQEQLDRDTWGDAGAPPDGRTLLHYASLQGSTEAVQVLLQHRADPSRRDVEGRTARELAASHHHDAVLEVLAASTDA